MAAINEYEIFAIDHKICQCMTEPDENGKERVLTHSGGCPLHPDFTGPYSERIVFGTAKAPNSLEAITLCLTRKFTGNEELVQAVLNGRKQGRCLILAGMRIQAKKLS